MFLIIGSGGQLGRAVRQALKEARVPFEAYDLPEADITCRSCVFKLIRDSHPRTVINCAAFTDVDGAEARFEDAYAVNALGPYYLALACERYSAELVHISTDYVFDGEVVMEGGVKRPYLETDACKPVTAYGKTKLAGEMLVRSAYERHYILRTAWLYGQGRNFVQVMIGLAHREAYIRVICDQYGTPTSAKALAKAILALAGSGCYGLYHATCEGFCSRYEFAKKILELSGLNTMAMPVPGSEFPTPAKRPDWSVLENANLKKTGLFTFPHWEEALAQYIAEESYGEV